MKLRTRLMLVCLLAAVMVAAACGSNDFQETKTPSITLDDSTPQQIALIMPPTTNRIQAQTPIKFRNSGKADLKVKSIEWVAHPDRLVGAGEFTGDHCQYDANSPHFDSSGTCGDGTVCWAITGECRKQGLPQTPITLPVNQLSEIDTMILPGSGDIVCPDAPAGRDVPTGYCGELVVKTNAANDSPPTVTKGTLHVFFTHSAGSGEIGVSPEALSFSGVQPGSSDTRDFTITNTASEGDLKISEISLKSHTDTLSITGAESAPTTIGPGEQKRWTVKFSPSTNWDQQTFGTNIVVNSSATNKPQLQVPVTVSSQTDLPAIKIDPQVLRFDSNNQQTLTISNEGGANLTMQSFTVVPSNAGGLYSFSINGQAVDPNVPSSEAVIQPGSSKTVTVSFSPPSGPAAGGIGTLQIGYNYFVNGQSENDMATATLLGNAGDAPVGIINPNVFTFRAASGNQEARSFGILNAGTQPLNITGADFTAATGSDSAFAVSGLNGATIAAGAIKEFTVNYTGDDNQTDNVTLSITSNTAGSPLSLLLDAEPGQASNAAATITPGFGNDTATVGASAQFSALQSTGLSDAALNAATWTLLSRPDGSAAYINKTGSEMSFFPDVAGQYKISLLVDDGLVESQATYSFTAQ